MLVIALITSCVTCLDWDLCLSILDYDKEDTVITISYQTHLLAGTTKIPFEKKNGIQENSRKRVIYNLYSIRSIKN